MVVRRKLLINLMNIDNQEKIFLEISKDVGLDLDDRCRFTDCIFRVTNSFRFALEK